jgi:hypothetical protein
MHLIENFVKDWGESGLPLKEIKLEEKRVVEAEGKKHETTIGYEVPVWRLDKKNLNGRTYSTGLAEKVIKNAKKTFCLKDHPEESDGSVDRIAAIAENPHIRKGIFYVDSFFIDEEFEAKTKKIIERGLGLGVSSSAYGDIDDDGNVLEEGFEVERYFDFVLNPSYEVYLTKESTKDIDVKDEKKDKLSTEKVTNSIEQKKVRNLMNEDSKLSLEEKNLKLGVRNLFNEADSKEDIKEKLSVYKEVLSYCEGVANAEAYVEEAQTHIDEIEKEIHELAEKGKELDSVQESKTTLEEENKTLKEELETLKKELEKVQELYDKATELADNLKLREKKLKEMYDIARAEKNGMVSAEEYKELHVFSEQKEKELETAKNEIASLKKQIREMKEKAKKLETEIKEKVVETPKEEIKEEVVEESKEEIKEVVEEKVDTSEVNQAVLNYYEDLVFSNPRVEEIKTQLLECRTLGDAQVMYLNLKDLVEDEIPVPGSLKAMSEKIDVDMEESDDNPGIKNILRPGWK